MTDLKTLRALCDAATGGKWPLEAGRMDDIKAGWFHIYNEQGEYVGRIAGYETAKFIAATNPQTVRALIDEIEKYRAALGKIADHGMPTKGSDEQTWRSCAMSVDRIARQALKGTDNE